MINIRKAQAGEAAALLAMARSLAEEIGDGDGCCTLEQLQQYGFGAQPVFQHLIAEQTGEYCGLTLYSPVFSTNLGAPGVYLSDLWVAREQRSQG
ncbi:MAG: hypothetical protein R3E89_05035 [Thiolinea sp.]